jgi:hypothetical protein
MPRPPNWLPNRYPSDCRFKQIARITRRKLQENPTKLFPKYGGTRRGTSNEDRAYNRRCRHHALWIGDTGRRFGKPHAHKIPASAWLCPRPLRRCHYTGPAHIIPMSLGRAKAAHRFALRPQSLEDVRRQQSRTQALQKPAAATLNQRLGAPVATPAGYTSARVCGSRASR